VGKRLVIGTRGSKLALWQANHVADLIRDRHPEVETVIKHVVTTGDRIQDVPLSKIGGKGLFSKELENELLSGDIDLAVHSMKDMPTVLPDGLALGAVTERAEAEDALISPKYLTLDRLPAGARVGTSSLRRKAQLLSYRPDLEILDLRGNLDTRLAKLVRQELDAILLAVSGLKRLGWEDKITQVLPPAICLPAVGQGALAVEIRDGDAETLNLLAFLNHRETAETVAAERAFLHFVEGGCQVPIGVYGQMTNGTLRLDAVILSVDGRRKIQDFITGERQDGKALGEELARRMYLAGGREILAELSLNPVGEEEKV
jgi:hydroxymethylbilane synthase